MTSYQLTREALEETGEAMNFEDWMVYTFWINNPTNIWTDKTGATVWYFNINLTAALALAFRGGENNPAMLRLMMKGRFLAKAGTNPLVVIPLATYGWFKVMEHYEPHEHHQKPSYWRSIAQAIGAGGVGVGTGADSFV